MKNLIRQTDPPRPHPMRDVIAQFVVGEGRGIVTAAESRALGCSSTVLKGMARDKALERVTLGAYVSAALLRSPQSNGVALSGFALAEHQHLLRLDAILRLRGDAVAASHQSAALAWGLPVPTSALGRIHVVHAMQGKTARRRSMHTVHTCELDDVITLHRERRLVVPALAVVGLTMEAGLVAGVAGMDAAIRTGRTSSVALAEMIERMRHSPRLGLARRALDLSDGLAESPGETRLRLVLVKLGISFRAQHWIRIGTSEVYYRTDFYVIELGVVLEYDGQVKYADRDSVTREKTREDDLRLDGFGVGRVTAKDLDRDLVRKIIAAAARQAQERAKLRQAEPPPWAPAHGGIASSHDDVARGSLPRH